MDASAIQAMIGAIPGGGIAALCVWFALRKDGQYVALMQQMVDLVKTQAVANAEMKATLDGLRDAIRLGTRS